MGSPYYFQDTDQDDELVRQERAISARWASWANSFSPDQAANLSDLSRDYWWMRGGASLALAEAGHGPSSPVGQRAGQVSASREGKKKYVWDHGYSALKALTRNTLLVLGTPLQAVQGVFRAGVRARVEQTGGEVKFFRDDTDAAREWVDFFRYIPQEMGKATGLLALGDIARGESKIDLGTGFFPGGTLSEEHQKLVANVRVNGLEGKYPTFGRVVAVDVTEPDTIPFNAISGLLDFGIAMKLDPAVKGLRIFSQARAARRLATPEHVEEFFVSNPGGKLVNALAEEKSFYRIWRDSGKKFDPETALRLRDADTPTAVQEVFRDVLGTQMQNLPRAQRAPQVNVRRSLESVRMLNMVPGNKLDPQDARQAVEQIERLARNAKMPTELVARYTEQMAEATVGGGPMAQARAWGVFRDLMGRQNGLLNTLGVDTTVAKRVTRAFADEHSKHRLYYVDDIGRSVSPPSMTVGDKVIPMPSPHLPAEFLNRPIPMPDVRTIRRLTSEYPNIMTNPAWTGSVAVMDFVTGQIFKPLALLRAAYVGRVVGEEQMRMAGATLDSAFKHPLSYIAWITSGRRAGIRATKDALDDADELIRALSQRGGRWRLAERNRIRTQERDIYEIGDPEYPRARAEELVILKSDPLAQRILADNDLEKTQNWFFFNSKERPAMHEALGPRSLLDQREASDAYIKSVSDRIRTKTGMHPDLVNAVRTGTLRGERMLRKHGDLDAINPKFARLLEEHYVESAPQVVQGTRVLTTQAGTPGAFVGAKYNQAVDFLSEWLMVKPTNVFSRGPTAWQFYWRRATELIPHADESVKAALIGEARKFKIPPAAINDLEKAAAKGTTGLNLKEVQLLAKGHAVDATKDLLYDWAERGQFFDITRNIFPFGEAWKELMVRWPKIAAENPVVVRRFQQTVGGARGSGFFYRDPGDPQGEEYFAYPGSEILTGQLTGVPVRFRGRVSGLSLMTNVFPGIGPVLGIASGALIPRKPGWDTVREVLLPYGEPELGSGVLESFFPPWMKKFQQALAIPSRQDERLWMNTVYDVARYLATSRGMAADSPEVIDSLLSEAEARARSLYMVRGAAQFVAPSAPQPEFLIKDRSGQFLTFQAITQDFQQMQKEDYEMAPDKFLQKYGEEFFLFMQGKSRALMPGVPVTEEALDWARDNPAFVKRYEDVWGLFAPVGETFDYDAYLQQFEGGLRQALTPDQAIQMANHRVASMIYRNLQDQIGARPNAAQRTWLRDTREQLKEAYPGFQDFSGLTEKKSLPNVIGDISKAIKHPAVRDSEQAQSIALYLSARDRAMEAAKGMGLAGFQSAQKAAPIRTWLEDVAVAIAEDDPDFVRVWEAVFEGEFPKD